MAIKYTQWIPPVLIEPLRAILKRGIYYSGSYPDWESASKEAGGYDAEVILERVKLATLQVAAGKAVFERDSVLFDKVQHSFPLLSGLLRAAAENHGELSVLDFGGSLGSSYFQCRDFLSVLAKIQWNVIEQPHFVRCGREYVETDQLKFYFDIEELVQRNSPNVALCASVLQYLPEPYAILDHLAQTPVRYLIIDRTPFSDSSRDVIAVQHVPPEIYSASYACRIFSKSSVVERLSDRFEVLADFDSSEGSLVGGGVRFKYGGMILRRK